MTSIYCYTFSTPASLECFEADLLHCWNYMLLAIQIPMVISMLPWHTCMQARTHTGRCAGRCVDMHTGKHVGMHIGRQVGSSNIVVFC